MRLIRWLPTAVKKQEEEEKAESLMAEQQQLSASDKLSQTYTKTKESWK